MSVNFADMNGNSLVLAILTVSTIIKTVMEHLAAKVAKRRQALNSDKLIQLQSTADSTHRLVNSDSEKQMAIAVATLRSLVAALERIATDSNAEGDVAAVKSAKVTLKEAERQLIDHQLAQARVDAVEAHVRQTVPSQVDEDQLD